MGTKLVTNRNITVTSRTGSSIRFTKGKPTHVPDQAVEDCLAAGAIPLEGEEVVAHRQVKVVDAPTGAERKQRILDSIESLVMLNERGTFNANGAPKQNAIEKAVGFTIDTREIETLWHEFDVARKQDTIVDANEVITINEPNPNVIENLEGADDAGEDLGAKESTEKDLGATAVEGTEGTDKPVEGASTVTRADKMAVVKASGVEFPGNISNAKLEELYIATPKEA